MVALKRSSIRFFTETRRIGGVNFDCVLAIRTGAQHLLATMSQLPSRAELEITPQALAEFRRAADPSSFRIVDCREEDEFAICQIEGAELIPLSRFGELAPGLILPTGEEEETPVIIYCHHGMRSLHATLFLRERGLEQVWSMSGGIDQWSSEIDQAVPRY